jgi:hypothetical protein
LIIACSAQTAAHHAGLVDRSINGTDAPYNHKEAANVCHEESGNERGGCRVIDRLPRPRASQGTRRAPLSLHKLYALDTLLSLKPEMTRQAILDAIEGHVMATGELVGTYERK